LFALTVSRLLHTLQEQDQLYTLLLNLQHELLVKMRDGVLAKEVYAAAVDYIKAKKPDLEKNFAKNMGFGVSYAFLFRLSPVLHTYLGYSLHLPRWA
jgi:nucleosome binding factor SPN SPT16 subunit